MPLAPWALSLRTSMLSLACSVSPFQSSGLDLVPAATTRLCAAKTTAMYVLHLFHFMSSGYIWLPPVSRGPLPLTVFLFSFKCGDGFIGQFLQFIWFFQYHDLWNTVDSESICTQQFSWKMWMRVVLQCLSHTWYIQWQAKHSIWQHQVLAFSHCDEYYKRIDHESNWK